MKYREKLNDHTIDGLKALAEGALSLDEKVSLDPSKLLYLLEEIEDLRVQVEHFEGGYCECGREAEYCRTCVYEER